MSKTNKEMKKVRKNGLIKDLRISVSNFFTSCWAWICKNTLSLANIDGEAESKI